MPDSIYKVIELIGVSNESWEQAAKAAVEETSKHLRDLRVAEVSEQDLVIENGKSRRVSHQVEGVLQISRHKLALGYGSTCFS